MVFLFYVFGCVLACFSAIDDSGAGCTSPTSLHLPIDRGLARAKGVDLLEKMGFDHQRLGNHQQTTWNSSNKWEFS
jgi:hypothetical protein